MTENIKEMLEKLPEELRNKLRIDVWDENGIQIDGLETVIQIRNIVDIDVRNSKPDQIAYTIKTKNGGEFVIKSTGSTYVTIV